MGTTNHTPGKVRYLTYILEFPDGDHWLDQIEFVNELDFFLKQTRWATTDPGVHRDLLVKGEASFWTTHKGASLRHVLKVQDEKVERKWGLSKSGDRADRTIAKPISQ